jgi:hypothetical protein
MISLFGCAAPRIVKEVVYIDAPCERAADYAPIEWISVRWVSIEANGTIFAATPDIQALIGNLQRLTTPSKHNPAP